MLKQPQGVKLLTNISVVRLVKGEKKFEIACYPNTVAAWRQGVEMPLNEVLQLTRIYQSVEKGEVAKKKDLKEAFGKTNEDEIILEILKNGEIQKGEKERKVQLDSLNKDIMILLTQKLIHKETKKPISMKMAEKLIKDLKYNIVTSKTAKQQSLLILKLLKKHPEIPIERMPMVISVDITKDLEEEILNLIKDQIKNQVIKENSETRIKYEFIIDPSAFHELQTFADKVKEKMFLEIVSVNQEMD
ncbi:rRNA metabolism protein SBDS family protein [Entamoeba histolytica KU27]|uniref:rRNA metabolism protein SBDS family protein n=1 Tax=Entamoeba histolytica KU27 TaxID=885311 RepID=M2Q095_ENTHI|nr:rRNA metabolism protein SBDS family protein [Entamoeba histolytica KU27]